MLILKLTTILDLKFNRTNFIVSKIFLCKKYLSKFLKNNVGVLKNIYFY